MTLNRSLTLWPTAVAILAFFVSGCATEPVQMPRATGALMVKARTC